MHLWALAVENFKCGRKIKVEEFFNLFFSDNAVNFIESFHRRCGDKEFKCSSWCPYDKFGHYHFYFGQSVIETPQEISDVPYGDYFRGEVQARPELP
ncbi:hypothetical protein GOBAR_DD02811 [Gossypium barbadense]|nr:hypothetical protein GOBAR_DD02811 [Gossypium barbadense]